MNDFEYDVMVKKRIARGAANRKRGSKSQKCTLPSDYLTHSQWKKRNGDVIVFSMDSPVKWADFIQLSAQTQIEYLGHLVEKFHASGATISEMMGVSYTKFVKHCKEIGFSLLACRGHNMSAAQRAEWNAFAHPNAEESASEEPEQEDLDAVRREAVVIQPLSKREPDKTPSSLSSFSLCFSGAIDPDGIANSIRLLMGPSAYGTVEITCKIGDIEQPSD